MAILTFKGLFEPQRKQFNQVKLNEREIHNCVLYMTNIYNRDSKGGKLPTKKEKYEKMFVTLCALTAISRVIDYPIVDYKNISKDPISQFRDLVGQYFDVIVFNYDEFPLFYYKMYKKALFVCKLSKDEYIVCGYGTPYVINSFHSKSLVSSPDIRQNSNMSAYYGFEHLKRLPKNVYDFKLLIK